MSEEHIEPKVVIRSGLLEKQGTGLSKIKKKWTIWNQNFVFIYKKGTFFTEVAYSIGPTLYSL